MQSTNRVLMIRPARFDYNKQTAEDNLYQTEPELSSKKIQEMALEEFDTMVGEIRKNGITVEVFQDTEEPHTPDSIFPNNWFSTHDSKLVLYPMYADNRRDEVGKFKEALIDLYQPESILDLTQKADDDLYLESTGAMIFDRDLKKIYVSKSNRASIELVEEIARNLEYKIVEFESFQDGAPIYHTNVLMSVTSDFAFVGSSLIAEEYRQKVLDELSENRKVIDLTPEDIKNFAGNVIELNNGHDKFLLISEAAVKSLDSKIVEMLEKSIKLIRIKVPTIEKYGGGSVRCMVGEIF